MKVSEDPRFSQAVQNYEIGLKAMQGHKYDKAKAYFEKVVAGPSPELADRASVHLHSCNQQMSREGVFLAIVISECAIAAAGMILFRRGRWKRQKI